MKRWTWSRTNSSNRSHVLLAFGSGVVVLASAPWRVLLLCPGFSPVG